MFDRFSAIRRTTGTVAAVVCGSLGFTGAAAAAPVIQNFSVHGSATAGWVTGIDAPGDTDGQSIRLSVPDASSYAVVNLGNLPSAAPASGPSFVFEPSLSGPSAGSPRLAITFSDGDYMYAVPAVWTADAWSSVGGANTDWFDAGSGSCPALSNVGYQQALACHEADHSTVTDVYLIADSSATGYVVYADDLDYGGTIFTTGGTVLGVKATKTALSNRARVSSQTGRGTVGASCGLKSGSCHFSLTLTAKNKGGSEEIGTIGGTIGAGKSGTLKVALNSAGRHLLQSKHTLAASARGVFPGGTERKQVSVTLT